MALQDYGRIMQSAADFAMQPYNALMDRRKQDARNKLLDLQAQRMQGDLNDDAEWDRAFAAKDVDTMLKIDPHATQAIVQHWQQQKMSGLEDIPISRQKVEMPAPVPGRIQAQRMSDGTVFYTQDGRSVGHRVPERAPQPGPESFSPFTQADGTVVLVGNRGTQRATSLRGKVDAPVDSGPKSEGEKKATLLFGSIYGAAKDIKKLAGGTDTSSRFDAFLGAIPLDADMAKQYQSQDYKKYESAAKRWSANLLYMKSGATATPEEVQSTYMQFFPQPGEGTEVKAQKEAARLDEMKSIASTYPWLAQKFDLSALENSEVIDLPPRKK